MRPEEVGASDLSRPAARLRRRARDGGSAGARWSPFLVVGLSLIGVQTVLRLSLLLPGAYWQDDFVYLQGARAGGLSEDYLMQRYNGHLMPAGFLLNWVVAQFPGSFVPAAVVVVVLQVLTSVLLLLVVRRAIGEDPSGLVGLTVYLFTPLALAASTWWAAATQAIPLQLSFCLSAYCLLRYRQDPRVAWFLGVVGGLVLGLLFWEKAVIVPVLLVGLVGLVGRGGWRGTVGDVWRLRGLWTVLGAVTGGYTAYYLSTTTIGDGQVDTGGKLVSLVRLTVLDTLAVGVVGGPWTAEGLSGTAFPEPGPAVQVLAVLILLVVAAIGHLLRGRRSARGWLFLGTALVLDLAITAWGRGYWGDLVGRDPRYISDLLPVVALVLGYVLAQPRPGERRVPAVLGARPWRTMGVVGALALASSVLTSVTLAPSLRHEAVQQYVGGARQALESDPGLVLFDGQVPEAVMISAFGPSARVSSVLGAYGVEPRYDATSERLSLLDDSGRATPIGLAFPRSVRPDTTPGCGEALSLGESARLRLDGPVDPGVRVLRLDYFTSGSGDAVVRVGTQTRAFPVSTGLRVVYAVVPGGVEEVTVTNRTVDGTVCVSSVAIGVPVRAG